MIPTELLKLTEGRALGILPYGQPGTRKTLGIHTLPPPIRLFDFEGGTSALLPWMRSRVNWDGTGKIDYTDEDRAKVWSMISDEAKAASAIRVQPGPYIDAVWFDTQAYESYVILVKEIKNFDRAKYNSIAVDSLQEFSADVYTYSKGSAGNDKTMHETGAWSGGQERARMLLRDIRSLRDSGIFVYMTCSETIDKDYVTDPRNQKANQKEEPISVKGTVNLSGQLVPFVQHVCDLMIHTRFMGAKPVWVMKPEPVGAGGANWEAKDRTGRVKEEYNPPNVRLLLDQVYGEELRKEIYRQK